GASNNITGTGTTNITIGSSGNTGQVTFQGSANNTYTGSTTVSFGTLRIDMNGASVIGVPGDLIVAGNGNAVEASSNSIASTSNLTVAGSFTMNSSINQTFATTTVTGGMITRSGGATMTTGAL